MDPLDQVIIAMPGLWTEEDVAQQLEASSGLNRPLWGRPAAPLFQCSLGCVQPPLDLQQLALSRRNSAIGV